MYSMIVCLCVCLHFENGVCVISSLFLAPVNMTALSETFNRKCVDQVKELNIYDE